MHCPYCTTEETKVIDSRLVTEGMQVRRRRECVACSERFTTYERAELVMPQIIKRDQRRSAFDEDKLRKGMMKALEKRPISVDQVDQVVTRLRHKLSANGEREVSSALLGEWVMEDLK